MLYWLAQTNYVQLINGSTHCNDDHESGKWEETGKEESVYLVSRRDMHIRDGRQKKKNFHAAIKVCRLSF